MIQANELRKGNKLLNCDNEIVIVKELRDEFYLNESGQGQYYKTSNGIPLTPEILEKCGAMLYLYQEDEHKRLQIGTFTFSETKTGIILFDDTLIQAMDVVEVQYLHQLQNLYFALTGEELNVNI